MKFKVLAASMPLIAILAVGAHAQNTTTTPSTATEPTTTGAVQTAPAKAILGQQAADEMRSSKVVGMNVYNSKNEKIGDINDLILAKDGKAHLAIVGVGGFLGMNEKNVAIPFGEMKFSRKEDGTLHAVVESTKETLQSAPNYVFYQSRS